MKIIQRPCPNYGSRLVYKPQVIVVHIMVGSLAGTDSWFASRQSAVSSHYGVGKKGEIHQYVNESMAAWHAGRVNNPTFKLYKQFINPNLYTIGIECEGDNLAFAPELQMTTLVDLIKDIALRWNIPLDRDHIIGHYQVDGINKVFCPSPDHTIVDKIVARINPEEMVCVMCPKSKVEIIQNFLNNLKPNV